MSVQGTIHRILDRYLAPMPRLRWITVRALITTFVACYCVGRFRVLTDFSHLSIERFDPVGLVTLVNAPIPHVLSVSLLLITVGLALLVCVGRFTRVTAPLLALSFLWVTSYRSSWGMVFHTENLIALHLIVLALGTWLADTTTSRDTLGGWPLRLMSAITLATYVLAGVAKLRNSGLDWLDGEILRNTIAFDALRKAELGSDYATLGGLFVQQAAFFQPLAIATLVLELGAPLALLHRYLRWTWIGTAWGFHLGVQLLMWIGFPYPLSLIAYASLLPVERLWRLPYLSTLAKQLHLAQT